MLLFNRKERKRKSQPRRELVPSREPVEMLVVEKTQ